MWMEGRCVAYIKDIKNSNVSVLRIDGKIVATGYFVDTHLQGVMCCQNNRKRDIDHLKP